MKRTAVFILSLLFLYAGVASAMEDCLSFEKHAFSVNPHHLSVDASHTHPETPYKADTTKLHCLNLSVAGQPFTRLSSALQIRPHLTLVRLLHDMGVSFAATTWWRMVRLVKPPERDSQEAGPIGIPTYLLNAVLRI